jgi:hypothetical protein
MSKVRIVPDAVIADPLCSQQLLITCFLACFLIGRRFIGCGLDVDRAQAVCAKMAEPV